MSSAHKLLPCPFCASEHADIFSDRIACSDCGASTRNLTQEELTQLPTVGERAERMASLWNRRAQHSSLNFAEPDLDSLSVAELTSLRDSVFAQLNWRMRATQK